VVFLEPFHADVAFWHIDATVLFDVVFKSSHNFFSLVGRSPAPVVKSG
jgi:hypothetical protein